MSKYTEKNAAKDTGASIKNTTKAWHSARDDAQKSGHLSERKTAKTEGGWTKLIKAIFKSNDDNWY